LLAYWPLEPEFAGSNPAEAVGFFRHPKNSQYAFLRKGSKICPMSQLCGMSKIPSVFPEIAALMAKFGVEVSRICMMRGASGDECGNYLLGVRTQ
jgi:hypothetical protein